MSRSEKQKPEPTSVQRILLIRLRRIGDVVLTTPAITALRRAFPQSSLSYIIEEPYRRLVEDNPDLDEVIVLPQGQRLGGFLLFLRKLRKKSCDIVLDFHGGPRASWIAFFAKAKYKVGYRTKYKGFIYTIALPRSRKDGYFHSVENHLNLVKSLGVAFGEAPPLYLPPARKEEVEKLNRLWEEMKLSGSKVVACHISAGNSFRDWGAEKWAALAAALGEIQGLRVLLIGGAEDETRAAEIVQKCKVRPASLVGMLNLAELKEAISRAALFVGPDSGPMHIAAASGTPIVALFGPTIPANFLPWGVKALILEKDLDCRPCKQKSCVSEDIKCMRSITVEEVLAACRKMLGLP